MKYVTPSPIKNFSFFFLPASSKSLTQHMLRGKHDVCSVKGAKSRNKHYQTRKPRDSNQKQFRHCHGMIYDRINKGRKRATRGRERTMLCTSARQRPTERQRKRRNLQRYLQYFSAEGKTHDCHTCFHSVMPL